MLQLEPAKRIPLGKVLEHRWMQGMEPDLQPTNKMKVFGSNDNILWNSHVLAAIQKMNYDVERCKQVRPHLIYASFHIHPIIILHSYYWRPMLVKKNILPALSLHTLVVSKGPVLEPFVAINKCMAYTFPVTFNYTVPQHSHADSQYVLPSCQLSRLLSVYSIVLFVT